MSKTDTSYIEEGCLMIRLITKSDSKCRPVSLKVKKELDLRSIMSSPGTGILSLIRYVLFSIQDMIRMCRTKITSP